MHARVPYDTERQSRLMWRMNFECDPADEMNRLRENEGGARL